MANGARWLRAPSGKLTGVPRTQSVADEVESVRLPRRGVREARGADAERFYAVFLLSRRPGAPFADRCEPTERAVLGASATAQRSGASNDTSVLLKLKLAWAA